MYDSSKDFIIYDDDEDEEEQEDGDSDKEGDESNLLNILLACCILQDDKCKEVFTSADAKRIVLLGKLDGEDEDFNKIDDDNGKPRDGLEDITRLVMIGAPKGWLPLIPSPTFAGYLPKHDAPSKEDINNPAGWSMFIFTPVYNVSIKKDKFHSSPTGARVVLANNTGKVMHQWMGISLPKLENREVQ